MSQYFIDKLVYNNDTLDIHDTEAREMINTNTTNIQALSARVTKNANDIDALENTTDELREDLDNVEDRVSVTEAEIDGLKTRTTSLEGKMVTVENRLDGHDTKISDLEDRMDVAENNIIALDGRMTAAENDIDAAEHRLDLVEAKNDEQDIAIDDLEENVSKNTADIVDIKDDLTGIHKDIDDLDDRITASTYEAGIGIYFGQGREHTNINVEDEILDQINQNTIDIQNLKTRVTNVENRLTVVEGDITDIKAEIVSIKADITDLKNRVTALEQKVLPAGGTAGQVLTKNSSTDFDAVWSDVLPRYSWQATDTFTMPTDKQFCGVIYGSDSASFNWSAAGLSDLVPTAVLQATGLKANEKVMFFKTEAFSVVWIIYSVGMTVNYIKEDAVADIWHLVSQTDIPAGEIVIGANGLTYTAPANRVFRVICGHLFEIAGIKDIKASIKITYEDSTVGYEDFTCAYYKRFSGDELHITGLICKHNLADVYKFNVKATGDAYTPYNVTFNSATL